MASMFMNFSKEQSRNSVNKTNNVFAQSADGGFLFPTTTTGRKRKQTLPVKVVKKRGKRTQSPSSVNDLQDQAPELGSLKGDYSWMKLLSDDFADNENEAKSKANAKTKSNRSQANNNSHIVDDFLSDVMLTSEITDPRHINTHNENDENICSTINSSHHETIEEEVISSLSPSEWMKADNSIEDLTLSSIFGSNPKTNIFSDTSNALTPNDNNMEEPSYQEYALDNDESLDGFLKDVDSLDLTVTGKQIEPPAQWVPVGVSLDSILCEKQDDNLGLSDLSSINENNVFSPSNSFISPSNSNRSNKRMPRNNGNRRSNASKETQSNVNQGTRMQYFSSFPLPHQELKSATDTIESLLASEAGLDGF